MLVLHGNLVLFYSMLLGTFVWNVQYGSCSWILLEFEEAGMVAARVNNHLLQVSHCKQTETARDRGDQEVPRWSALTDWMGGIWLQIVGVGFSSRHLKSTQLTLKYVFELIVTPSSYYIHLFLYERPFKGWT